MDCLKLSRLLVLLLLLVPQSVVALDLEGQEGKEGQQQITPGILIDSDNRISREFVESFKEELNTLLPEKVHFIDDFVLSSNWSPSKAKANFSYLENHPDVDLIITFGVMSSGATAKRKQFLKPTMAIGIIDPQLQGLGESKDNRSGKDNLTYILFNHSIEKDFKSFRRVYPFKKLGIIFDQSIATSIFDNNQERPKQTFSTLEGATVKIIGLKNEVNDALDERHHFDAAFVGYLGRFEEEKKELVAELTKRKIPTFGASVEDIDSGVLAAIFQNESKVKLTRRVALNIERLLDGANFSTVPVSLDLDEQLTINMNAARKIDHSPKFSVLASANVVNELAESPGNVVSLGEVINETLEKNLYLNISKDGVGLAQHDLKLAKSGYYPKFSVGGSYTVVDQERAEGSGGQLAERTVTGAAQFQQLLYSNDLNTNISVSKQQLIATKENFQAQYLDTIYSAAEAYFNVLTAKTRAVIQKKDLELTKKHLAIATQRQAAGYSDVSDVYRWQSSIAKAVTALFEAENSYRVSKINLNRLLNRPLNGNIAVWDESLSTDLFKKYTNIREYSYIDNPAAFDRFVDFMVMIGVENAPELREVGATLTGLEQQHRNYEQRRYLPVATLNSEASRVFDRAGEGSSGVGVEDSQWTVGLNLSWNLYEGGSTTINKMKTRKQIGQLKKQSDALAQDIETNVRSAALEVVNKLINLGAAEKSNRYGQKSLELVQDSYSQGKVSVTDLIDAQNDALESNLDSLNATYEYILSVFLLERVTGKFNMFSTPDEQQEFAARLRYYMDQKVN